MWQQIQRIPTPFLWVSRRGVETLSEEMGHCGAFESAAWDYVIVDGADQSESRATLGGTSPTFNNGDVNVNAPLQTEIRGTLHSSAPVFAWEQTWIFAPDQSDRRATVASGSPTFAWEQLWIFAPDQSESRGTLAAQPVFANG
jgi:hypothetical protein